MRVLGIETSCDETGIAIYDGELGLLSHVLYSQIPIHADYGGVVPELASRDHIRKTIPLIKQALREANCDAASIEGVAYTAGPGLAGALLVGAAIGRSLALAWGNRRWLCIIWKGIYWHLCWKITHRHFRFWRFWFLVTIPNWWG